MKKYKVQNVRIRHNDHYIKIKFKRIMTKQEMKDLQTKLAKRYNTGMGNVAFSRVWSQEKII